ncbi:MAG: hypothetical protein ACJAYU_000267 [Bradymonadia bacterium]|jgi:hypothetical protein
MRHSFLPFAALVLIVLAGCSEDPGFWPSALGTDTATDTAGDAGGSDVSADTPIDASADVDGSDTALSDTSEDPTEPDANEPDVSVPDVNEPDVVEDTEPDAAPGLECDDGGEEYSDCDACQVAELGSGGCCESAGAGCSSNSDCVGLLDCRNTCEGDEGCVNNCATDFSEGIDAYETVVRCVVGNTDSSVGACRLHLQLGRP